MIVAILILTLVWVFWPRRKKATEEKVFPATPTTASTPIASVSPDLVAAYRLAVQRSPIYSALIAQYRKKYECWALGFSLEGDRGVVVVEPGYVCGDPYGGSAGVLYLARGTDKVFRRGENKEYGLGAATSVKLVADTVHEEILEQARLEMAQPLGRP